MRISDVEERIIESIRENGEYTIGKETFYYCGNCECMQAIKTKWINGRVGHIDNWIPDEVVTYCDECGDPLE